MEGRPPGKPSCASRGGSSARKAAASMQRGKQIPIHDAADFDGLLHLVRIMAKHAAWQPAATQHVELKSPRTSAVSFILVRIMAEISSGLNVLASPCTSTAGGEGSRGAAGRAGQAAGNGGSQPQRIASVACSCGSASDPSPAWSNPNQWLALLVRAPSHSWPLTLDVGLGLLVHNLVGDQLGVALHLRVGEPEGGREGLERSAENGRVGKEVSNCSMPPMCQESHPTAPPDHPSMHPHSAWLTCGRSGA